jgi:hypothetical protein
MWQSKLGVQNLNQLIMIKKIGRMMFMLVVKEGNMNSSFIKFINVENALIEDYEKMIFDSGFSFEDER